MVINATGILMRSCVYHTQVSLARASSTVPSATHTIAAAAQKHVCMGTVGFPSDHISIAEAMYVQYKGIAHQQYRACIYQDCESAGLHG